MGKVIIEHLALALTVVALIISIWQSLLSRMQTNHLRTIGDALSTRYVGVFPEYIPEVARLIDKTKQDLLVLCTLPIHAAFSNRQGWLETKQAIERALASPRCVTMRCVFGTAASQKELLDFQFKPYLTNPDKFTSWRNEPETREKLDAFSRRFLPGHSVDEIDSEAFQRMFETCSEEALASTFVGASVKMINSRMSVYLWISDRKEAVFAIVSVSPVFASQAFWTTDSKLISAVVGIYDEFEEQGQKFDAAKQV